MSDRVGCNLLWLVPGLAGGSEEYCTRLLRAAAAVADRDVDIVLFVNRSFAQTHADLCKQLPTRVAPLSGRSKAGRIVAEQSWLAWQARRAGVHVVHHLGGTMPFVRTGRGMVLMHDLQPWAHPENFDAVKRTYLRATVPGSVRRAGVVTTLSNWVADDVSTRLDVDRGKFVVIPPGRDDDGQVRLETTARVLAKHHLEDRPFFVFPAVTYAHKNHATLVRAFRLVADDDRHAALVLTGRIGPAEAEIHELTQALDLQDRVRRLGRVDESELDVLYRHATALTFPSLYEGFGLPVLEAMSRACPVVASDACALPEVVADGGILLGGTDVDAWGREMVRLLADDAHRQQLIERGERRSRAFAWDRSAGVLLDLYRREVTEADA